MSYKTIITNDSMRVQTFSRINERGDYKASWLEGEVGTSHGFVGVYSQGSKTFNAYSRLDFIWNGRLYMRKFNKRFTKLGLARKATAFASQISGGAK